MVNVDPEPTDDLALPLIDLKAAARLASGRGGRPPHISTLSRWIQKGALLRFGRRLRLKAVRVPSGWRTSRCWLDEFLEALTADRLGRDSDDEPAVAVAGGVPTPTTTPLRRRTATERLAASRRAGEILERLGC